MEKDFRNVFANFEFSESVKKNFNLSQVNQIKFSNEKKELAICLLLKKVIDKKIFLDFENELKKFFPHLAVKVYEKYNFDCSLHEKIKKVWPAILFDVKNMSNVCYEILQNSDWQLQNENILQLKINSNLNFFVQQKKLTSILENIINEKIDANIKIVFADSFLSSDNNFLQEKQKELAKEIYNQSQNLQAPQSIQSQPNKNLPSKKSVIKVNDNLQNETFSSLENNFSVGEKITVAGKIFMSDCRQTKNGKFIFDFAITDKKSSITVKFFADTDELKSIIAVGKDIIIKGKIKNDDFLHENVLFVDEIAPFEILPRMDNASIKRVELHAHTQMSSMDSVVPVKKLIERAAFWQHKAIAITDHGVVQAFPEAMEAAKKFGIKVIYGTEAYLIDDLACIVQNPQDKTLDDNFVVFDLETTGISKDKNKIIEIGAVKISGGKIVDRFSTLVNPHLKLPPKIVELVHITDEMLVDAPDIKEVFPTFAKFISGCILVAHNADFDAGFINRVAKDFDIELDNCVLDTLGLSRILLPHLPRHKLNFVAEHLNVKLEHHHRAVDDAEATAHIFLKFSDMLRQKNITKLREINLLSASSVNKSKLKAYHAIILVKNQSGLKNLYQLVSKSHIDYFYKRPRIPKSEFVKYRDGLILGSACEAGELYRAIFENKSQNFINELVQFYDYLEVQPLENNFYMLRDKIVDSKQSLIDINKKIIALAKKFNKLVVATGDVHFLEPEDEIYRRIIMSGEGFDDADNQPPLFFHTTDEMLKHFDYLDDETAFEIVVKNPNLIADSIENIKPIPDETFSPKFEGADELLKQIVFQKAHEIYGETLPDVVASRINRELDSIIKNGFTVMYIIAQKLVQKSLDDGYLVGSRGSVGSSFVATMANITEVNPLPPHYVCLNCKYSEFDSEEIKNFDGSSGCDLPDKICPVCSKSLNKDGHDIPFETFLGFDGDKEPDIDLNFSGEYQLKAHAYTEELFGSSHVFKAGTISTLAEKTAYGYVKKYFDERNLPVKNSEINRLKLGCSGVKKTTGQHPGGLMIVPSDHNIFEFCPIQRPANDSKSNVTTTHFDYHSISGRLLKLDLLGHDVPTIIHMLEEITGIDPTKVPLADKKVISLFTSPKILGDINCDTGTLGLPEFGTQFVRQMLLETKPKSFGELVRISGLSHGTDVWLKNAQELIKNNVANLKSVIPTRDDIMLFLIKKGIEKKTAFKIMEAVRKGKGLKAEDVEVMRQNEIPDWYIDSCKKIKYLFPKGHAVAYVMMTMRIGYFKVYHPYAFYAATFSVRSQDFNYNKMCCGKQNALDYMQKISALGKDATLKDKNIYSLLEIILEMYERNLKFVPLDLYKSDAKKFLVTENGLLPPLCTIEGLGESVAQNIVDERMNGLFNTIEEFRERTKANKNVIDLLKKNNVLRGIPETNQLTFI